MSSPSQPVTTGYSAKSSVQFRQRKDSGYQSNQEMADVKQPERKEKPLNELMTHSIVDIYVGPESTHWPIHEKLLCYYSPFFTSIFYDKKSEAKSSSKTYGLPDEDDLPFELLVGWLYSRTVRPPNAEKDIGPLLDLYFLADKFEMEKLGDEVVHAVREFYHSTSTYPGLRRVQYVYSNTDDDNTMREMMVASIARYLTLGNSIPNHWAKALKRNGQLALDIIRSIQEWHLESRSIPDVRDINSDGGKLGNAFSGVEDPNDVTQDTNDSTLDSAADGEETLNADQPTEDENTASSED